MNWINLQEQEPKRGATVLIAWKLSAKKDHFFYNIVDVWNARLTCQYREYAVVYWCEITDPKDDKWQTI